MQLNCTQYYAAKLTDFCHMSHIFNSRDPIDARYQLYNIRLYSSVTEFLHADRS